MFNYLKVSLFLLVSSSLLVACGDSDESEEKAAAVEVEATAVQLPVEVSEIQTAVVAEETVMVEEEAAEVIVETTAEAVVNANPQTHTINAEARVFKPDTIFINPGDSVGWRNMNSHNTVSVEGLIPEGATSWAGKLGENLKITLDIEGVYAYVCQPHIGFGMVGLIIVGNPGNLEEVKAYARDNLKGPFRRVIGKLNKVKLP